MGIKEKLAKGIWRSDVYYQLAKKGSLDVNHFGMKTLIEVSKNANRILDLGCGEGTRLNFVSAGKKGTGIDISSAAIKMAKEKYPKLTFMVSDLEKLSLKNESFDLVYSAYVLEHLDNIHKVIFEAIRVTEKNGFCVLIAPNYGAPNRCSPPFRGSRTLKLVKGLLKDLLSVFNSSQGLDWDKVTPIGDEKNYNVDWDTTIEPYLTSLLTYLKKKNMKIMKFSSCWSEELKSAKIHQKIFRFLGELGIYPFLMWGPHLVVVAQKV